MAEIYDVYVVCHRWQSTPQLYAARVKETPKQKQIISGDKSGWRYKARFPVDKHFAVSEREAWEDFVEMERERCEMWRGCIERSERDIARAFVAIAELR